MNDKKEIVCVGGNPLGWNEPFDEHTLSGKRLRQWVKNAGLRAVYIDLWDNPDMEAKWPHVTELKFYEIHSQGEEGKEIIVFGQKQKRAIFQSLFWFPTPWYPMVFLPHPASRRKEDLAKAENGLKWIAKNGCPHAALGENPNLKLPFEI